MSTKNLLLILAVAHVTLIPMVSAQSTYDFGTSDTANALGANQSPSAGFNFSGFSEEATNFIGEDVIGSVEETGALISQFPIGNGGIPFGGLIVSVTLCTCTNNYLITVNEGQGQKNLLVTPPFSKLYQYYLFMPGQWALGTYTPGQQCMVYIGTGCTVVQTDGAINSEPGAGSSGPLQPTLSIASPESGSGLSGLFGSFGDMLKGAASNIGKALGAGLKGAAQQAISKFLNPGQEHSSAGKTRGEQLRGVETKNYSVANEKEFSGNEKAQILDRNGTLINEADSEFVNGNDDGTLRTDEVGVLADGTVVAYDTTVDGIKRYYVVEQGAGTGKTGVPLSPFRSIAVDPNQIPLGTYVQIPGTRGMELPDGTTHNGIWRADDILDDVTQGGVSLFIGVEANREFLRRAGIRNQQRLSIILLEQQQ